MFTKFQCRLPFFFRYNSNEVLAYIYLIKIQIMIRVATTATVTTIVFYESRTVHRISNSALSFIS